MSCCADGAGQPGSPHSRLHKQAVVISQDTTQLRVHVDGQDQTISSRPPQVWAPPRLLSFEQVIEHLEDLRSLIPEQVTGMADSADLAAAKRLLDAAKDAGFAFQRIAPGEDAPLLGVRQSTQWLDEIHLGGFWAPQSCTAIRRRRSSLVVPGGLPVAQRVSGDALIVLHTVVTDWPA